MLPVPDMDSPAELPLLWSWVPSRFTAQGTSNEPQNHSDSFCLDLKAYTYICGVVSFVEVSLGLAILNAEFTHLAFSPRNCTSPAGPCTNKLTTWVFGTNCSTGFGKAIFGRLV